MAEDVAVEVNHASLPQRIGEVLGGALGKPQAGIRDDQPYARQPALLQVLQEPRPTRLVLFGTLTDTQYLPVAFAVHRDRQSNVITIDDERGGDVSPATSLAGALVGFGRRIGIISGSDVYALCRMLGVCSSCWVGGG